MMKPILTYRFSKQFPLNEKKYYFKKIKTQWHSVQLQY